MASSRRQSREKVLVESPEWKRGNIGYIDPTDPVKMFHGRQHYLIHWENTSYHPSYIDSRYVQKMEDISKTKRTWYSPNEVRISPEQRISLKGCRRTGHWAEDYSKNRVPSDGGLWKVKHLS